MNTRISLTREQVLRLLDGHAVQQATALGMLEFEAIPDEPWKPMVPFQLGDETVKLHRAAGISSPDECWWNGTYDCFVSYQEGGLKHLSIKRLDRAPLRNWRHLQQIKNEICGEMCEGVEIYPGEYRIADNSNQYHLWVMPEGVEVPVGFPSGMVVIDPDEVHRYNTRNGKGRQEPMQEGLTVGQKMNEAQVGGTDEMLKVRDAIIDGVLKQ